MYSYTLKNLVQFSGLDEQMIVLWNKKFKIFREEKIDRNSIFNQDDLKKLIIISFLINSNSKYTVEKLSTNLLQELQIKTEFEIQNYLQKSKDYKPLIHLLIYSCFSFDSKFFDTILTICFKKEGIQKCCLEIVFPFISTMSEILEMHTVQESIKSFSKNLIRKHLFYLIKSTQFIENADRKWLLFLPKTEFHDIELLYTYLLLKANSEKCIYLGENQELSIINECLENINITHVFTYISKQTDLDILKDYLILIKKHLPGATIFVATYEKLKEKITDEVAYINVNNPKEINDYLHRVMVM